MDEEKVAGKMLTVIFAGIAPHERRTIHIYFTPEQSQALTLRQLTESENPRYETVVGVWLESE